MRALKTVLRVVAGVIASLAMATASAFSWSITASADGKQHSDYWAGDYAPDANDCNALFTGCGSYGTTTGQYVEQATDSIRLTRSTGDGWEVGYISFSDETNVAFVSCPSFVDGSNALWGAAGVYMAEGGTTFLTDYKVAAFVPPSASNLYGWFNYGTGSAITGPVVTGKTCTAVKHVAATNVTTLWGATNVTTPATATWTLLGSETRDWGAGRIGAYAHSNSSPLAATFLHDNIVADYATAAAFLVDDPVDPPGPYEDLPATFSNTNGGPPHMTGAGQMLGDNAELAAYQSWLGSPVDIQTVWIGNDPSWAQIASANGQDPSYLNRAMAQLPAATPIVISYPMMGAANSTKACANLSNWDLAAGGSFDSHWVSAADNFRLKAISYGRDPANHVIRLGWEMNGNWYAWSVCNKQTAFKAYWERIYDIWQAEIPGILFDFSFAREYVGYATSAAKGSGTCNLACFAPAARTYNVLARSHHDGYPQTTSEATWLSSQINSAATGNQIGWNEVEAFAATVGKRLAITEWHIQYQACWGEGISQNPNLFLTKTNELIRRFIAEDKFAWETYLSFGCSSMYYRPTTVSPAGSGQIPAQTYLSLWLAP